MQDHNKSSYRSIMKGTAIFGGVQIFNILVNIVRGKFIAIFLGPSGMGVYSLLLSTANTIIQFSGLGLNMSAVKEISQVDGQSEKLALVIKVFRRLVLLTACAGALITICISPWLSHFAFGNEDYTWSFIVLGGMVFFTIVANGEISILQGIRRLRSLAVSTVLGALVGLLIGVPLYYFGGKQGIVPAMIVLALSSLIVSKFFTYQISLPSITVPRHDGVVQSKKMLSLGVILMISSLIGAAVINIINAYIRYRSGTEYDVGLYQSATSITNQYVGLVFTAMAVDYFPRLAGVCGDKSKLSETVNQQIDIVMLIVTPLILVIIITAPIIIRLLLSKEFMPAEPLVRWLGFGIFFKALSYPIGYIAFAKGDKRIFFWLEGIVSNLIMLITNVIGYRLFGLQGLGGSFLLSYILYVVIITSVARWRYGFTLNNGFWRFIMPLLLLSTIVFLMLVVYSGHIWSYLIASVLFVILTVYCYRELNKRIDIKEIIRSKFCRKTD